MLDRVQAKNFEVLALHHAEAILTRDMHGALDELENILVAFEIPISELVFGGGGEGQGTQRLRKALTAAGWLKRTFQVRKTVDGEERESASHEVDHVKRFGDYTIALEIEWNNKDPFFDRDLENFKRLHSDGAISVGTIITRGKSLHENLRSLIADFARRKRIKSIEDVSKYYRPN
jgi:Restriction endonuclease BglII